jgi:hypothetical protein
MYGVSKRRKSDMFYPELMDRNKEFTMLLTACKKYPILALIE